MGFVVKTGHFEAGASIQRANAAKGLKLRLKCVLWPAM